VMLADREDLAHTARTNCVGYPMGRVRTGR
jgi:hypothetical protein